jgi:hypothetical protein
MNPKDEYDLIVSLKKAVYFLNSVDLARMESEKIEGMQGKRNPKIQRDPYEMIRLHMSHRDLTDIHSFVEKTWKELNKK